MSSTSLVSVAHARFVCPTLTHVKMEDGGGVPSSYSNCRRGSVKGNVIAQSVDRKYYATVITTVLKVLSHYTANYANAEVVPLSCSSGCKVFTEICEGRRIAVRGSILHRQCVDVFVVP